MKKNRSPITMERSRTEKLINKAILLNRQCYVPLHIAYSMSHAGILDELFEDFMKPIKRISFPTVEIPTEQCICAERWGCIVPENAVIVNEELPRDLCKVKPPTYVNIHSAVSQIWHFAGHLGLTKEDVCFCEYDANKREGKMAVFLDGKDIPQLLEEYPQLKQRIKIAKHGQYDWLVNNC